MSNTTKRKAALQFMKQNILSTTKFELIICGRLDGCGQHWEVGTGYHLIGLQSFTRLNFEKENITQQLYRKYPWDSSQKVSIYFDK